MIFRLANLLMIILMVLVAFVGCDRAQRVGMGGMPADPMMDESMTEMQPGIPVKLVWLIDYPEGGKDAYVAWIASIASILQAPEELVGIKSYDNAEADVTPNRLVEFEFNSFLDSATYFNRPEIAAIFEELPNHSSSVAVHTFIQRSDYAKGGEGPWNIKVINLINYPLAGKQAYLEWVASISPTLTGQPQLKAIAAYDNYYGESPHRLVQLEFANQKDADAYEQLEEIQVIEDELDNRTGSYALHTFELRSDYTNE